jgi:hypothetical protein
MYLQNELKITEIKTKVTDILAAEWHWKEVQCMPVL